jgi:hypothetical protein
MTVSWSHARAALFDSALLIGSNGMVKYDLPEGRYFFRIVARTGNRERDVLRRRIYIGKKYYRRCMGGMATSYIQVLALIHAWILIFSDELVVSSILASCRRLETNLQSILDVSVLVACGQHAH